MQGVVGVYEYPTVVFDDDYAVEVVGDEGDLGMVRYTIAASCRCFVQALEPQILQHGGEHRRASCKLVVTRAS